MDWYRHHDLAVVSPASSSGSYPGLDSLPLGSPVLEPDLHLHLGQPEVVSYLGPLRQTQILLAVELLTRSRGQTSDLILTLTLTDLLQLQELFAGEGRPPPPGLALTAWLQQPAPALYVQPAHVLLLLVAADAVAVLGYL